MKLICKTALSALFFALFSISCTLNAQDCEAWYPMDEGAAFEMTSYSAKGKVTGRTMHTIKEKSSEGGALQATVSVQYYDKKDKETMTSEYDLHCKEGQFSIDMRSMMSADNMSSMQNMEVDVDADEMAFPADLSPGTELPDASLKVSMKSAGFSMSGMQVLVTNRKVGARESVTTPAGTFDCVVISQDVQSKTMGIGIKASSKTWYAKGAGAVKTESYNKNGKLMGSEELTMLKKQ